MSKVIIFVIAGVCFIIDAVMRYTSLGMDYVVSSLFLGHGLDSFSFLNLKDFAIFLINALLGVAFIFIAIRSFRKLNEDVQDEEDEFTLGCKDCKQCYPNCPLNLCEDDITPELYERAFYNFAKYRKDESNKAYNKYLENVQHSEIHEEYIEDDEEEYYDNTSRSKTKIEFVGEEDW